MSNQSTTTIQASSAPLYLLFHPHRCRQFNEPLTPQILTVLECRYPFRLLEHPPIGNTHFRSAPCVDIPNSFNRPLVQDQVTQVRSPVPPPPGIPLAAIFYQLGLPSPWTVREIREVLDIYS